MKNSFRNLMVAGILTSVFMIGTQTAKAGLLMSDFAPTSDQPCTTDTTDEQSLGGLLISDFASTAAELATTGRTGLMLSDRSGLMLSDRTGIMLGDFAPTPDCK